MLLSWCLWCFTAGSGDNCPPGPSWLQNPSFVPPPAPDDEELSESSSSDYDLIPEPKKGKTVKSTTTSSSSSSIKSKVTESAGEKDLYRIDRQADSDNLRYDSVYSGGVAVYRRKFDCLGMNPHQKLKWTDGRSRVSKRKRHLETQMRYFMERNNQRPSELAIPSKAGQTGRGALPNFIKIEGNPAVLKSGESLDHLTADRHMSQLTGQYNRSLLEQPSNVSLWLEFVVFQDQLLEWGHLPGETSDNVSHRKRALTERKIAILEKALDKNPLSEDLLLAHMSLVQEVWTTDKIIKKWKNMVFVQPNRPLLWLGYIQFCQTNFSSFSTSSLISLYKKCITTLSSILQGTLKSHLPLPNTASYLLAIFSQFCSFLKEAGLMERAVASYQALMEFNLCAPPEFAEDVKSLKEFFETFWDSSSPRFGEDEALGLSNWMKKNTSKSADVKPLGVLSHSMARKPSSVVVEGGSGDADAELVAGLCLTDAWFKLEDHRMMHNCLPWQSELTQDQSEEDSSDPDRMVTFDDISHALFPITNKDLKLKLVLSFLHFLGAPVQLPFHSLLSTTTALQSLHDISSLPQLGPVEEDWSLPSGLGLPVSISPTASLSEFAEYFSSQVLSDSVVPKSPVRTPCVCNFISNACNQSLSLLSSPQHQTEVAKVWLSFLFQQVLSSSQSSASKASDVRPEIRSVQKLFKSLLRLDQHRNDLVLWNCYALFEYSVGNFKDAANLYRSVLARYPTPSTSLCCTLCECFMGIRKGVWQEVELDTPLCLYALVSLAEGGNSSAEKSVSPARVLKARSYYSQIDRSACGCEEVGVAVCHGYFEYLTRGLKESCLVFDKWADTLKCNLGSEPDESKRTITSNSLKGLYLKQLQLLEHHSLHHMVQPALLRRVVEQALLSFPDEGRFMATFVRSERQTFISGRMRRHFDSVSPVARSALPWLFAVAAELDRYQRVTCKSKGGTSQVTGVGQLHGAEVEESSVGTVHRVRSLLARAVATGNARHCPLLWRIYLVVQVSLVKYIVSTIFVCSTLFQMCINPKKVNAVFYQAVHSCPWSKVWVIAKAGVPDESYFHAEHRSFTLMQ